MKSFVLDGSREAVIRITLEAVGEGPEEAATGGSLFNTSSMLSDSPTHARSRITEILDER